MIFSMPAASSLVVPSDGRTVLRPSRLATRAPAAKLVQDFTWHPQDLTQDRLGFLPIPDDDYVKQYQRRPELWPVEFFLTSMSSKRRTRDSLFGLGQRDLQVGCWHGVPATRWILSLPTRVLLLATSGPSRLPPTGTRGESASMRYFEFPQSQQQSWTFDRSTFGKDAHRPRAEELGDPELEEYARKIRDGLRPLLSERCATTRTTAWGRGRPLSRGGEFVLEKPHCLAAIQGTLRMSGLFSRRTTAPNSRYIDLGEGAPDPAQLVRSTRIFTMFPQMPDPMPLPSTSAEDLRQEIASREARMAESGRDPHQDRHGRWYTHKSTSNPSNTIHGVTSPWTPPICLGSTTCLPWICSVPRRSSESGSRSGSQVLDADGNVSTEDTKPTFISGFIVRQLVKEGVIST